MLKPIRAARDYAPVIVMYIFRFRSILGNRSVAIVVEFAEFAGFKKRNYSTRRFRTIEHTLKLPILKWISSNKLLQERLSTFQNYRFSSEYRVTNFFFYIHLLKSNDATYFSICNFPLEFPQRSKRRFSIVRPRSPVGHRSRANLRNNETNTRLET